MYIANGYDLRCAYNFIEMCCKKYHYKEFDIVSTNVRFDQYPKTRLELISKYYNKVVLVLADKERIIRYNDDFPVLRIRSDIPPQKYKNMPRMFMNSVNDVLITGDQSLADCLSWVPEKNIWYQTLEWKKNLADNLRRYMPNKFIGKYKTTCGGLKCVKFHSTGYKQLIKKWDFRILGRKKLDRILTTPT
jgi:hypothetical protein